MSSYKAPTIERVIFKTFIDVKINDINYGNHLGHDSLVSLLHESRVRFLKSAGFTELNICGAGILVTSLLVNYLGEAFYADNLTINIGIGEISKISVELIYEVVREETNEKIAQALTTLTFFDYSKRKITKIPQEFLSLIK